MNECEDIEWHSGCRKRGPRHPSAMRPKVVKLSRRREKSGALGGTVRVCYDEEKI